MKRPAFDYESLTRPPHAQQRNKELGRGVGTLRQNNNVGFLQWWCFCSGGSWYCDWGSYNFVRLENPISN